MKKILLLALLFVPFALGNGGCADLVSGQFLQNVQLPVLDQSTSPAADAVRILFYSPLSLDIGAGVRNTRLYVLAHDAVEINNTVGIAGWIYYMAANETAYYHLQKYSGNFTYVCESGVRRALYATASLGETLALEGGRTVLADVVRLKSDSPNSFYDSNYSLASDEFVVVTSNTVDSNGGRVARGTMFAKQGDVYYYVGAPGATETSAAYPSLHYLACCTPSNCTSDFESALKPSSCSSSLFSKNSSCLDGNTLAVRSCAENSCIPQRLNCDYGCANGACIDGTPATCKDFYGENTSVRNFVTGVYQNKTIYEFSNSCESAGKVRAFSCAGTAPTSQVFDCPLGCAEGKCIQAEATASPTPAVEQLLENKPPQPDYTWLAVALLVAVCLLAWWVFHLPTPKKR